MKSLFILILSFFSVFAYSQSDTTITFKKRVLENTEVDILSSYYNQEGDNASVTGGVGDEKITDFTPNIIVSIPLNDDDVLTVDVGFSTYTSASSSNLNPFDRSGASQNANNDMTGSPWVASSGASQKDTWTNISGSYSHSSDDRNKLWDAHASFSKEFDYTSIGFGGGYTKLFNEKNTEINVKGSLYLDTWKPVYPTELISYDDVNGDLYSGFFANADILNQQGMVTNKNSITWDPINYSKVTDKGRNTYSLSVSFSQILSRNAQFSLFFDMVQQDGWLSNPMQRVYFSDRSNYYIGNAESIPYYTSRKNRDVFMLADDIERMPSTRLKIPVGARFHYFINEYFAVRTYYRFYYDDWGITSNTINVEIPVKISQKFTLYPSYRFYNQSAADYFAPFDTHRSTSKYYTSDYDLSKFSADQFGFGISYTDIFTRAKIGKFGLKSIDIKYNNYKRNTGLNANFVAFGVKFVRE